jgi:hypothetical protein
MIKAIFYSKFDTIEGKDLQYDDKLSITYRLMICRSKSRPPGPRRSHRPFPQRALTTTLPHLLGYLLLRDPPSGALWKPFASLHKRIPYPGLPHMHEISAVRPE